MTSQRALTRLFALLLIASAFSGNLACSMFTMAPVLNVSRHLTPYQGPALTAPEVRALVLQGLAFKGWNVDREEPAAIIASVRAGGHSATVRIAYDAQGYEISHVSSSPGLKYDGTEVHVRYNRWVNFLDEAIRKAFAALQTRRATETAPVALPTAPGTEAPPSETSPPAPSP